MRVAFGWLSECLVKKLHAQELSRIQSILCFHVILQHDWPIEQCLLYVRVFFGGKKKRQSFYLFIHWLIKQITNTYRNHFSRSNENRSNQMHELWINNNSFCSDLVAYKLLQPTKEPKMVNPEFLYLTLWCTS